MVNDKRVTFGSVRSGKVIAERGLRRALAALKPSIAFLDFETVSPAVPVWPGSP